VVWIEDTSKVDLFQHPDLEGWSYGWEGDRLTLEMRGTLEVLNNGWRGHNGRFRLTFQRVPQKG